MPGTLTRRFVAVGLTLTLCACGGNGQTPFPVESASDTAVIQSLEDVCSTTYTIHRDGTAQRIIHSCGSGTLDTTLTRAIVSNLFADLQAAQPLSALTSCPTVDVSTTIAWNGQQSGNLGACTGSSALEQTLSQQVSLVISAMTPVP